MKQLSDRTVAVLYVPVFDYLSLGSNNVNYKSEVAIDCAIVGEGSTLGPLFDQSINPGCNPKENLTLTSGTWDTNLSPHSVFTLFLHFSISFHSSSSLFLLDILIMALCRNRLGEERKQWRKDHPYVRLLPWHPSQSWLWLGILRETR
jgi:hypothetical protein